MRDLRQHPRRDVRLPQRGTAAVELALAAPVLLVLLGLCLSIGLVLVHRHRLADAISVATRSAAIQGAAGVPGALTPANVRAQMESRLGAGAASQCESLTVDAAVVGALPLRRLEVTARCRLREQAGYGLLRAFTSGLGAWNMELQVRAAMPF